MEQTLLSWAEYAGKPYELIHGKVIPVSPAGGEAPEIELILGKVTGAEGGYWLLPQVMRAPDIGFYTLEKHHLHTDNFHPFPPDLAVEIVSPIDKAEDIQEKIDLYIAAGVLLIWVIYPKLRKVVVHYPDETSKTLSDSDMLEGESVLPGFNIKVSEIFP